MIKTVSIRILIVTILIIIGISPTGHCLEISETTKEIHDDLRIVFVVEPKESKSIFGKYKDKKYFPIFTKIFSTRQYNDELFFDLVYLNAVLKDGRYLEYVREISSSPSIAIKDVNNFYYYRIDYRKLDSIKFLKQRLDNLVKNPSDSYLITFLAFFDDVGLSLSYMDKLAHVADGATSELLSWAVNYLFYENMQNKDALGKIKKSYCYELYIKKRPKGKSTDGSFRN
jgi:hypothetical protein